MFTSFKFLVTTPTYCFRLMTVLSKCLQTAITLYLSGCSLGMQSNYAWNHNCFKTQKIFILGDNTSAYQLGLPVGPVELSHEDRGEPFSIDLRGH